MGRADVMNVLGYMPSAERAIAKPALSRPAATHRIGLSSTRCSACVISASTRGRVLRFGDLLAGHFALDIVERPGGGFDSLCGGKTPPQMA